MEQIKAQLKNILERIESVKNSLDLENIKKKLATLEKESLNSDFWSNIESAKKVMGEISELRNDLESVETAEREINNINELASVAASKKDLKEVQNEIELLDQMLKDLERSTFFSGQYDRLGAILSIHAGQGGVEAMDWAEMLLRMYIRFAEKKGWKTTLLSETRGEEAGIKSASIEVSGRFSYGLLKYEAGTHRLVRQSPFNADRLRQTSFALLEVLPVLPETEGVKINSEDIEMEAFRASGPGGQNVQKVASAVRIRHKPTGIAVTAQSERSQAQNRENALKILRSKLTAKQAEQEQAKERELKGEFKTASWGNQIRSYVLHPYKMVKDLRTGVEVSDPYSVLDGDLNELLDGELIFFAKAAKNNL